MTKEKLLEFGLNEETAAKVAAGEAELKDYVTKEIYDTLQGKYTTDTDSLTKKLNENVKNSAVDMAILKANGKNSKAIKALLDMEKIAVKDDGSLEGLDIEALKESDGYLFDTAETHIEGTGFIGGTADKMTEDKFINGFMQGAGIKL